MKEKRIKKVTILITILLIFVYGILIPVVPLCKYLFSDAKVIRFYPYHLYTIKEGGNFDSYMKSKGWTYGEEMESGSIYVKGNSKRYIHVDNFIKVLDYESNIEIWQGMDYILNWPKFIFYIIFGVYILPIFGFIFWQLYQFYFLFCRIRVIIVK